MDLIEKLNISYDQVIYYCKQYNLEKCLNTNLE